ncbi:MAG: AmmeMemoRadiSam system protein B, partial [Candidatus Aenigmatarchaeota archaeon]
MEVHRMPAVAGTFYPSSKKTLQDHLEDLFHGVKRAKQDCLGVISPHAGYEYSGLTAAHAVSSLKPVSRFVILGPNHYLWGAEFSVMGEGAWATPLGECQIDRALAKKLLACPVLEENELAHEREHSVEVQLPFLQHRFKEPRIVPISIMCTDLSQDFQKKCELLGKAIVKAIRGEPIGIVASTDFSHYLPLKEAEKRDSQAIEQIKKLDLPGFFKTLKETDASICGPGPIAVMMV